MEHVARTWSLAHTLCSSSGWVLRPAPNSLSSVPSCPGPFSHPCPMTADALCPGWPPIWDSHFSLPLWPLWGLGKDLGWVGVRGTCPVVFQGRIWQQSPCPCRQLSGVDPVTHPLGSRSTVCSVSREGCWQVHCVLGISGGKGRLTSLRPQVCGSIRWL